VPTSKKLSIIFKKESIATMADNTKCEAYQFKVSPNTPPFVLNVTNYQLNGICTTAYCIYGDHDVDNMFKFRKIVDGWDDTVGELMADETFVLATDQSHYTELPIFEPGQPSRWLQYLKTIEDALDESDIADYTCIIQGKGWALVKFDNFQFLEGSIGMCGWVQKDWKNVIKQIHYGENPVNNINVRY
jgi:hypothetical protein